MKYNRAPEEISFSPKHKRMLRELTIDESGPGTVLHDFEAFLSFLREQEEMEVTGTHQLRLHTLPEINARLARPLELGLKRPQQKSYPHIHGLYLLVRASGLTHLAGTSKKPLLVVVDAVYRLWEGLNPTERYCTLLEAWLLRGNAEIINERGHPWSRIPDAFEKWLWFFLRIPDEGLPIAGDKDAEGFAALRAGLAQPGSAGSVRTDLGPAWRTRTGRRLAHRTDRPDAAGRCAAGPAA